MPRLPESFSPSDRDERVWVTNLIAGDPSALKAIYEAYFSSLWKFAARSVGPESAEDLVHDVFLSVWQRRETLPPDTPLAQYLFTAVRRRIIDTARHTEVEQSTEHLLIATPDTIPAHGTPPLSPEDSATLHDLTSTIARLLNRLSEQGRTLMTLRWIHGFTYDQIADIMGITPAAAKKQGRRLQLALTPLLARFRDRAPETEED